MASSVPQPSDSMKSKKKMLNTSSKLPALPLNPSPFSSPTPEKLPQPSRRLQNRGVVMSVKQIRNAAKSLRESNPDRSDLGRSVADQVSSKLSAAREQILSWPSENHVQKPNNVDGGSTKLPEKYELLAEFFNCLDSSIRLLRMKGCMTTFTNICPKIETLTERRFSFGNLAQLKFILPEAIVLKKVLTLDESTSCMKPDLHVTLEADAIKNDGMLGSGIGNLHMRKVFRARISAFVKSHPEGGDVPEETLPEPFNRLKQEISTNTIETSNSSLLVETSSVNPETEHLQTLAPSHIPQTFRKHFSNKVCSNQVSVKTLQKTIIKESPLPTVLPLPPKDNSIIQATPKKLASTPAKFMTSTPALQTPKRCFMSPDDDSKKSPSKLVKRALRTRSLKFDTPVKNAKAEDMHEKGCSFDNDIFDILPESLLLSIKEKEMKLMEERDPEISQAKRRQDMIAGLPKLFNMIHFFFQSIKRCVVTKDELIHKIIASHFDIVDRRELEDQLTLLLELAPEWISENVASSGDNLIRINKILNTESIHAKLAEAK